VSVTSRKVFHVLIVIGLIMIVIYFILGQENSEVALLPDLLSLVSRYKNGEIQYIDFSQITSPTWDKVYFFRPYTPNSRIYASLGFVWLGSRSTSIDASDGVTLIVFVKAKRVVAYAEFPRNEVDFSSLDNNTGYSITNAKFAINENGSISLLYH